MSKPVILITGALTGIGRATALAFAKNGAHLVVSGRRQADGKALEVELQRLGTEAVCIHADVRHDDEVGHVFEKLPGLRFGESSHKHDRRKTTSQKSGSIINISSTYGHEGAAYASVYAASKHAVEGFTKSAALEVASTGVRVNAVAPGPTDTGMLDRFTGTPENKAALVSGVPLGRVGKPADIANTILFLASDAASFITGQIVTVDGGKTAG
jgi:NAD(P)-dependent dehydrogenase (short-subunit alcohol dehydrogenase family)